jgi:hypothetical protein
VARREQGEAKKNRKLTGWSVPPGPTIMEHTEARLAEAVTKWRKEQLQASSAIDKEKAQNRVSMRRGIIRGLAIAVLAHRNSYYLDDISMVQKIEKEFMNNDND